MGGGYAPHNTFTIMDSNLYESLENEYKLLCYQIKKAEPILNARKSNSSLVISHKLFRKQSEWYSKTKYRVKQLELWLTLNKELQELNTKLNTITAVEDVEKLHPANLRKYSILMYRKIQVLEKLN